MGRQVLSREQGSQGERLRELHVPQRKRARPVSSVPTLTTYTIFIQPLILVQAFYDAPFQPEGIFDGLLAIPTIENTTSVQTFPDLVRGPKRQADDMPTGFRGAFKGLTVPAYSAKFVDLVTNILLVRPPLPLT